MDSGLHTMYSRFQRLTFAGFWIPSHRETSGYIWISKLKMCNTVTPVRNGKEVSGVKYILNLMRMFCI